MLGIEDIEKAGRSDHFKYDSTQHAAGAGGAALNPHHTHFVLTETHSGSWGSELPLRAQLEEALVQTCPVVTLCLQVSCSIVSSLTPPS